MSEHGKMASGDDQRRRSHRQVKIVLRSPSKNKKSSNDTVASFRAKITADSDKYQQFQLCENERKRTFYKNMTEEQRDAHQLWCKRNQKAYRDRQKALREIESVTKTPSKSKTRKESQAVEESRSKKSAHMRAYREKMSRQKRHAINKKKMEDYYPKRLQQPNPELQVFPVHDQPTFCITVEDAQVKEELHVTGNPETDRAADEDNDDSDKLNNSTDKEGFAERLGVQDSYKNSISNLYSGNDVHLKLKEELTCNSETDRAADDDNDDSDELNKSTHKEVFADRLGVQDSYKNSISNLYSGNDVHLKLKEELTCNSETDRAADDDNDDSDELNNSTDKEVFAERLGVQDSYKNSISNLYSWNDVHLKLKEELTCNSETDRAADDDNDDSDELNNSTDKELFAERLGVQDSYKNSISNLYSWNDVHLKLKEELTCNSETDRAADDDNDDSDELNNSTDKELFAEGLVVQTSYQKSKGKVVGQPPCINACDEEKQNSCGAPMGKEDGNDESERKQSLNNYSMHEDSDADHVEREKNSNSEGVQHVGDADKSHWKQKFSSDRIADIVYVKQEERMQVSNSDESKPTTAFYDRDSTPPCENFTKEEEVQNDMEPVVDDAQTDVKKPSEESNLPNINLPSIRHDQTSPLSDFPQKEGCLQTLTTQGITEKQENGGSRAQFGYRFSWKEVMDSTGREMHMKIFHKDKYFVSTAKVAMNQSESGQQRQKSFTCGICKNSFQSKSGLTRHINANMCHLDFFKQHLHVNVFTHHSPPTPPHPSRTDKSAISRTDKSAICDVCGLLCKDKSRLNVHTKVHTKPHKCPECQKGFGRVSGLKSHIRVHTGEKPFECTFCYSAFTEKSNLVKHQLTHTGEKPYTCDICNKSFSQLSYMTHHKKIHSRVDSHKKMRIYRRRENGTSEKKFLCELCGKAFGYQNGLILHQLKHTGKKPYSCDICGKEFYCKYYVKLHKIIHTGESSSQCSYCNRAFQRRYQLEVHTRKHTGERPYKCDDCGRAFFCKSGLKSHRKTHSDIKPYTCKICGKSFKSKKGYNLHESSHKQTISV